jgi:hypothetical protein
MKRLQTPPTKTAFLYEKNVIEQELADCSYGQ